MCEMREGQKQRDEFMAVDSVEDWLSATDPTVVENTLYGTMDYITALQQENTRLQEALEDAEMRLAAIRDYKGEYGPGRKYSSKPSEVARVYFEEQAAALAAEREGEDG